MRDTAYFDGLWETVQQEIAEAPIPIGVTREDRTGNSMVLVYATPMPDGRIAVDYRVRTYFSLSCSAWDTPEETQAEITGAVIGQELATIRHLSRFVGMTRQHLPSTPDFSRGAIFAEDYILERGIIPRDVLLEGPLRAQSRLAWLIRIPKLALVIDGGYAEIRGITDGVDGLLFTGFSVNYYPQTPAQVFEELVRLQEKWRSPG